MKKLPSQAVLRELLDCDPATGKLTWKPRELRWFQGCPNPAKSCAQWNGRFAGAEAFTAVQKGYRCGNILSDRHLAHRVIWKWVHGGDPFHIDHINGDVSDNRIENLRDVTASENLRNQRLRRDNKIGVLGVTIRKDTGRFAARIRVGRKYLSLGSFDTLEAAAAAREAASRQHGFHRNHGRAAS